MLAFSAAALAFCSSIFSQKTRPVAEPPRLVVGIVVDQMRYDYLLKFHDKFGAGGFRRLLSEGFNCENAHYDYAPTYTGPGHASIYAGCGPSVHGIVGNEWYSREERKPVYCASDASARAVGGSQNAGLMSPRRLAAANVADELRLFTNKKSKVVGVAIKDRGAILPAGHCPNSAWWLDLKTGSWMTSDFYKKELPRWVEDFNKNGEVDKMGDSVWAPLEKTLKNSRSIADSNIYEDVFGREKSSAFPHDLKKSRGAVNLGELVASTPFGNDLTAQFARAAIENEGLGEDEWPDLLALSFSSPDLIGHRFGPASLEVEDNYLRLDSTLSDFLSFLDQKIGREKWLVFLTADHGASQNARFLTDNGLPGGSWDAKKLRDTLGATLETAFGSGGLVLSCINGQVYFNRKKIEAEGLDFSKIEAKTVEFFRGWPQIHSVFTASTLLENEFLRPPTSLVQNGFMPSRSGDVALNFMPGWVDWGPLGATHGSAWSYDTRVPCVWAGWRVPTGTFSGRVGVTDIAPTLSILLNIPLPSGATGEPIRAILDGLK